MPIDRCRFYYIDVFPKQKGGLCYNGEYPSYVGEFTQIYFSEQSKMISFKQLNIDLP